MSHEVGNFPDFLISRDRITMADNGDHVSDNASVSEDSGDEESFYGFNTGGTVSNDDSDLDFSDLDSDEDGSEAGEDAEQEVGDNEDFDELRWTDQLTDLRIPDFVSASGINFQLPDNPKPVDFFLAFMGDDLLNKLVTETNLYARQKLADFPARLANFHPVTLVELKAFLAVNIIMGMVRLPTIDSYWSSDDFFGNVGIKKVMPRNRFREISSFLHFNDSTQEVARGTPGYDRLFKVRPVLNYVRTKCETNFNPTKNISVDEGMVPFRGRLSFRQYMPAKPTKYGIKVWMAADSSNGYVLNFDVYLGKETGQRRIHGLGYDVVTKMITPFMNKNHHVYFDNFFSSVRLLEHLRVQDTFACATVRVNRKDLPPCARQKLRPGGKIVRQKGKIVFTKWHDKRDVLVLSSNSSPDVPDVVIRRHNQQVHKPAVIALYNENMGGVDLADQLRKYYSTGRSCKKWYKYLFWYSIDVSVCNAFILYNHFCVGQGKPKLKQVDFRTTLSKQLIGGFSSSVSAAQSTKRRKIENFSLEEENAGKHFCEKIKGIKRGKRQCVRCKRVGIKTPKGGPVETSYECVQCGVALCRVNCFAIYHAVNLG